MSDCTHDWVTTYDFLTIGWSMCQRMFEFRVCRVCETSEHFLGGDWKEGGPGCYSLASDQQPHKEWVAGILK